MAEVIDLTAIMATRLDVLYASMFAAMIEYNSHAITLMYAEDAGGKGIDWLVCLGGDGGGVPFTPKEARNIANRFEQAMLKRNYVDETLNGWPREIREAADEAMDRNRRRITPKDVMAQH